ncbi:MAG: glycosyltransferase [Planctomycetota bacterium]|nr:glycosyltransferase [Planctomycetota bacterium]
MVAQHDRIRGSLAEGDAGSSVRPAMAETPVTSSTLTSSIVTGATVSSSTVSAVRARVAIIANAPAPYRLALHRRLIAGVPEVEIFSVFTHDRPEREQPWDMTGASDINPVRFGVDESCADAPKLAFARREWKRGGALIRWIREQDLRAVFMCGYNDPCRLRVIAACRRKRIPVFLVSDSNIHGDRASGTRRVLKNALVPVVLRACQGFMPCGSTGAAYFTRYGASPDRIFELPYEPDYSIIESVGPGDVARAQARFNLDPARRRIIFIGRMSPAKRPDLLLEAFQRIAAERPQWDLLMVGDGRLRSELTARASTIGDRNRVLWTGFQGDARTVATLYKSADVFVLPSDYEPWGVVVNEAAAAALALCVTSVVGAAPEFVKDGVNGRVFPPGDADALARALLDATDPANTDRYKRASIDVLRAWQTRTNAVQSFRKALTLAGAL